MAPRSCSSAGRVARERFRDREDDLGVDGHLGVVPAPAVPREELVVVLDDAVVDADDGAVPHGMVVGGDRRRALREVADVQEDLRCEGRHRELLDQRAGARLLLVHHEARAAAVAVGVADRVLATLGDPREQRLRGERAIDVDRSPRLYPAMPHTLCRPLQSPSEASRSR